MAIHYREESNRMFDRIMENLIPLGNANKVPRQASLISRKAEKSVNNYPELLIKKVKSFDDTPSRLLVSIWETDSSLEMFDYENKSVSLKEHKLSENNDIYMANFDRKFTKCIVTKANTQNSNIFCGRLEKVKGQHFFSPGSKIECFKVICNKSSWKLKVGNLIRVGRMKYFVKEMCDGNEFFMKEFERNEKAKGLSIHSLREGTCKFCLCDEKDNPDLLISPCSCKGSCAQVHLQCLKQWLLNKVTRKSTSNVEFLNYDNFSCEICKVDLPTTLKIDGKAYNMLQDDTSSREPYLILEGIPNEKVSTRNNLTIKLNFSNKNSLIMGRGHEADVRLEDVSISRQHCLVTFVNGNFEISDNNSKFGTLIKVKAGESVNLNENKIQVARMTLEISSTPAEGYFNFLEEKENYDLIKK